MLKLNASYSKKVPAESDYSSKSYHASVEVELADSISPDGISEKIHETFELVRNAVENEINGVTAENHVRNNATPKRQNGKSVNDSLASDKQLKLLFDLANRGGVRVNDMARERFNVDNYAKLTKSQCSQLIDELVRLNDKAA